MKKIKIILLLFLISTLGFAQEQNSKQTNANQSIMQLTSSTDTLQYALGAYLGQWMVKNSFEVKNAKLFLQGMDDVLQKKALSINDSTIAPIISAYQVSSLIEKNKLMEEQLFATLKGKSGVGVLPNGVNYIIRQQGNGVRPSANDTIVVHALGVLPDGTVFEDTYKKKQAITTAIGALIPGLNEAVQLMPVGSVWRIFIPSVLGYGSAGLQNIVPPHSALVFDIELVEIK